MVAAGCTLPVEVLMKSAPASIASHETRRTLSKVCSSPVSKITFRWAAVPSGRWGQKVGAVVVLSAERQASGLGWKPMDMRRALRARLANYKIPQVLRVVDRIDRNAMGKVNKKVLVRKVFLDDFSGDEM